MRAPQQAAAGSRRRYRVAGLVMDTVCRVPFSDIVLTGVDADIVLDVDCSPEEAPPTVKRLPRPRRQVAAFEDASGWACIDHRGIWLAVRPNGRASAGTPAGYDPAQTGAPSMAALWTALLVTGLGAHLVRARDGGTHVTVHAAGVAADPAGPAILLAGESGAGKSTVASELERSGYWWAGGETTRAERAAASPTGWRLASWWPVRLDFPRNGPAWPTYRPVGPRYLREPVPLAGIYWLVSRRRSASVRIEPAPGSLGIRLRRAARVFRSPDGTGPPGATGKPAWQAWERHGPAVYTVERPQHCPPEQHAAAVAAHARQVLGVTEGR